ncbi:hypothetical protein M3Y94_01084200 [Aphelenchoides besseyi]|nr:hypothetical protein M3Y94_01084200 [Aphelenchoides besseyi]
MGHDNAELLKRLRKEEANRKDLKLEVALASKMKKGGEGTLNGAGPKKGQKKGTPFPLPLGTDIICRSGDRYKIEASITQEIMVVRSKATQRLYGMKIEWLQDEKGPKQLIREIHVLSDATKHEPRFARHFPRLLNKGRVAKCFNFLVMTLGDMNFDDLRMTVLKNHDFTRRDAGRLSMQTFQAIHDLHSLGYLHRNLSPAKFMLGIDNPQIFYIIDFSRSHHFERHYDNKPRGSPRRMPKLKERTYLPRNYHRNKDIQRKDDLESWIYLCFNLFGRQLLPWNEQFSDVNMMVNKERLFCGGYEQCYKYVPRQFLTIMANLDKHEEKLRPDYTYIGMTLVSIKESLKLHLTGPFDFQKPPGKKVVAPSPIEEKEKHATLAVAEPKEEARSPATVEKDSSLKKRKGFKDESKSDEESKSDREAANEAEKERLRKEKEEEAARLATVEDEKAQAEIKRAKEEAAKLAAEKAQAEMEEAAKREKEEEATKLTTEDEKMQADAERDRKEKEDAQKKADAEKAQADLEREQKEKDDAAKLAELEAQKKRDEEAAAAAAAASSKEEPKAEAQPDEPAENNNFVKSTYLAPRMEQPEQPPEGASANSTYLAPTEDGAAKSTYLAPRMDQPEQQQPQ